MGLRWSPVIAPKAHSGDKTASSHVHVLIRAPSAARPPAREAQTVQRAPNRFKRVGAPPPPRLFSLELSVLRSSTCAMRDVFRPLS